MRARFFARVLAAALVAPISLQAGEMQTVFVDRIINASVYVPQCNPQQRFQSFTNQTFDPLSITIDLSESCENASGSSQTRHESTIGPQSVYAFSESSVACEFDESAAIGLGGVTFFMTNFELNEPTPYTLSGRLTLQGVATAGVGSVQLSGPNGTIVEFRLPAPPENPPLLIFEQTGELAAGLYTLMAFAQANINEVPPLAQAGLGGFDVLLAMTDCLCDLDDSGDVGLQDLAMLLANFGTAAATFEDGDFDSDLDVDVSDLARLLARFGAVCN